jgi:hypothetical protein
MRTREDGRKPRALLNDGIRRGRSTFPREVFSGLLETWLRWCPLSILGCAERLTTDSESSHLRCRNWLCGAVEMRSDSTYAVAYLRSVPLVPQVVGDDVRPQEPSVGGQINPKGLLGLVHHVPAGFELCAPPRVNWPGDHD